MSFSAQSEHNTDTERLSLGSRSRESLRDKLSICNSESFPAAPLPAPAPAPPRAVTSPGPGDIPRILVHSLGREETMESTLSSDLALATS